MKTRMGHSFEVRESDLLGRIGKLEVGGRSVETPYLFPVVHPVNQLVELRELKEMGFGGLMTNSYILYKRRRDEVLTDGIHRLLDFDGLFMTDSGGYQVLEYGDLDVTYSEIASFQSRMGSDLAVTLDRPTGYSQSRKYAKGTMEYSLKNALATIREFGASKTVWVGPVQGGLFPDLLKRSASSLVNAGFGFLALGSPVQVMENYRYTELVGMIVATRRAMPYSMPLHLFGAGHPHTMAMAVALGCDTFDSASYILFARDGRYMTGRGASKLREMKYLPCSCPVCSKTSVGGILELEEKDRTRLLALHNLHVLRKELESCKEAIAEGRLWDLVEEKAATHPRLQEAFRELAKEAKLFERGTASMKEKGLLMRGETDGHRPEISIARRNLGGAMRRTTGTALLLLSSSGLPITRLRFKEGRRPEGRYDVYKMSAELGLYPAELDFVYPFTHLVGGGGEPEGGLQDAERRLRSMGYKKVVVGRVDGAGCISLARARSRRKRRGGAPSPRSPSSRPR
ncbi:MAG: tRNA guanosine(15) transglycosylase TgtA [Nitrososphaerales archaeon]|nr:tRNA guanosine(15) transglycosylase TgtA [Nitrososphaerales archaeon]